LKKTLLNDAVRIGWIAAFLAISMPNGVALADVVVVVSAKSPVKSLTANQVLDIFLGRSGRFPNGGRAVPIDQQEGVAARNEFYTKLSGKSGAQLKAYWSKIIFTGRGQPPTAVADGYDVKRTLAANPSAIGYIDQSLVDDSVTVVLQGY
jgi:ABC-type phosphate transport system substrate-binding protein